ncbi:MAG TPA: hypothetical protein VHC71_16215 [Hyphomicrobium sp.]|jgi:hypothetical protein|nr:hypothetical protein [Hyphomicrobium sp.]
MTYVDHRLGNADIAQIRGYFPRVRSCIARSRDWGAEAFTALSSFLAYHATERGPTPSASALVYGGIAAAGAVLYEAWNADTADFGRPTQGLLCERGCLRRLTNDLHVKATDEIRLHQDLFDQRLRYGRTVRRPATISPTF